MCLTQFFLCILCVTYFYVSLLNGHDHNTNYIIILPFSSDEAKSTSSSYITEPVVGGVLALLYVVTITVAAVVIIILALTIKSKK